MNKKLLVLLCLMISSVSFAHTKHKIKNLVDEFYAQKSIIFLKHEDGCIPAGPNCIDIACNKLNRNKCDDTWEIEEIAKGCRGNYNGLCLEAVCSKLSRFDCDDSHEVIELAKACIGNVSGECVDSVCKRLGSNKCNDSFEVIQVAQICGGR